MKWDQISTLPNDYFIPIEEAANCIGLNNSRELLLLSEGKGVIFQGKESEMSRFLRTNEMMFGTKNNPNMTYDKIESTEDFLSLPDTHPSLFIKKFDLAALRATLLTEEPAKPISSNRERTLLKVIGALLSMKYKGSAYSKGTGPNASAIAEQFDKDLATARFTDQGIKSDTIRKTIIVQALEAIAENKLKNQED